MDELRCPSGHLAVEHVTKRKGQGRVRCTVCNWNDAQVYMGGALAEGVERQSPENELRGARVKIVGASAEGVKIIGGSH